MSDQTDLHPSRERLALFAHGRLPDAELTAVADHVSACDECCQTLQHPAADTLANLAHTREPAQPARAIRPDIPEDIAGIVRRMMAKNPADRHATAAEVAADLAPLMKNTEPTVPLPELPPPPVTAARDGDTAPMPRARIEWEAKRRRGVPLPLLAAGAGVISLLLVTAIYFAVRPPRVATSGRDTKSATANTGRDLGTTAATKGRRALFILPPAGLWNDDYQPARPPRTTRLHRHDRRPRPCLAASPGPNQPRPGRDRGPVVQRPVVRRRLRRRRVRGVPSQAVRGRVPSRHPPRDRRLPDGRQARRRHLRRPTSVGPPRLLGQSLSRLFGRRVAGQPGPPDQLAAQPARGDGRPLVTAGSGADAVPFADAVAKAMAGK